MLKHAPALAICLSLAAACASPATTSSSSTGNVLIAPTSSGSAGLAKTSSGTTSAGATGSATGSTGGAPTASGSATGAGSSSAGATGTASGGSSTGQSAGWNVVGSIVDPGQGNTFIDDLVPLPGPSNLPQVVFSESLGGVIGVFTTYWDGGYVAPELIFDGGVGLYNLQGTNWHQGATNLVVAITFGFNLITLEQVDGGPWTPVTTDVSPIPAGGMAPVFDQATGTAWIAGLADTVTNGSNLNLYRLDDAGVTVPFSKVAAGSISAAPCTKPDGGSLICVCYTTGFSENVLWVQTFDPLTQIVGTAGPLFDSADAGFDGFASGCAITETTPGTVVALAAGLGPGMPQNMQQYAWASFALTDLGTLQAPTIYASDAGSPQGFPALWTWNGDAFLLFRQTSIAPEGEVGVLLGGPAVPPFPIGGGVTNSTAYPAGYADSSNINYVALPTTAQGGKLYVYSLSP